MEELRIASTPRLRYTCGDVPYRNLYEDRIDLEMLHGIMDEIAALPAEARRAALARHIQRLEAEVAFIQAHVEPKRSKPNLRQVIYAETPDGDPVGRVVLSGLTGRHPSIEIRVLKPKRNRGYGREMLRAVIAAAFAQHPLDHLEYDVVTSNLPSRRLIRSLGGRLVYGDDAGEMYELPAADWIAPPRAPGGAGLERAAG